MERNLSLKTNWLVTKKAYDITIIAARQVKGNSYFQFTSVQLNFPGCHLVR